jgi:hypothetical protein
MDLAAWGVDTGYWDAVGQWKEPPRETLEAIARSMGVTGEARARARRCGSSAPVTASGCRAPRTWSWRTAPPGATSTPCRRTCRPATTSSSRSTAVRRRAWSSRRDAATSARPAHVGMGGAAVRGAVLEELGPRRPRRPPDDRRLGGRAGRRDPGAQPAPRRRACAPPAGEPLLPVEPAVAQPALPPGGGRPRARGGRRRPRGARRSRRASTAASGSTAMPSGS